MDWSWRQRSAQAAQARTLRTSISQEAPPAGQIRCTVSVYTHKASILTRQTISQFTQRIQAEQTLSRQRFMEKICVLERQQHRQPTAYRARVRFYAQALQAQRLSVSSASL